MSNRMRLAATLLLAAGLSGCASFWASVREQEREHAAANAEIRIARGDCRGALPSLERAQAGDELGDYAPQSTLVKAQCFDRIGRREESRAHYRLLRDFYPAFRAERIAAEFGETGDSLELELGAAPALGSLHGLELGVPRYSVSASRSHLGGAVLVRFWVDQDESIRDIRVLEMPHPLLASWAIEAVAVATLEEGVAVSLPKAVVTRFLFKTKAEMIGSTEAP